MLEASAIVVKITEQHIWVTAKNSSCAGCTQKSACSTTTLSQLLKHEPVLVAHILPVSLGETVIVGISESTLLRATFALYFLPLLALFSGAGLANVFISDNIPYADIGIASSGLFCLSLTLGIVRQTYKKNPPHLRLLRSKSNSLHHNFANITTDYL